MTVQTIASREVAVVRVRDGAPEGLDLLKRSPGANEFPLPTLAQQSDAVVIPAFPGVESGFQRANFLTTFTDRESYGVRGKCHNGKAIKIRLARLVARNRLNLVIIDVRNKVGVGNVKLTVIQLDLNGYRIGYVMRQMKAVMNDLCCIRGNLVIVHRDENVLRVAMNNTVTVSIYHECTEEMRCRINLSIGVQPTAVSDNSGSIANGDFQPHLVRIAGALREPMTYL